ncbi:MAG: hypothetical protein Q9M94_01590 [Candidatus Gracilibacteria bacterium]|nr:hypothetical protein [Candidatus Gracilibacteria bacterium]
MVIKGPQLGISRKELNNNNFNPEIKKFLEKKDKANDKSNLSKEEAILLKNIFKNRKNIYHISKTNLTSLRSIIGSNSKIGIITGKDLKSLNNYVDNYKEEVKKNIPKVVKKEVTQEPKTIEIFKNTNISEKGVLKGVKKLNIKTLLSSENIKYLIKNNILKKIDHFSIIHDNKQFNVIKKGNNFIKEDGKRVYIYDGDTIGEYNEKAVPLNDNISSKGVLKNVKEISLSQLISRNRQFLTDVIGIKTHKFSIIAKDGLRYNVISAGNSFYYNSGIKTGKKVYIDDLDTIGKYENNIRKVNNNIDIENLREGVKELLDFISITELPGDDINKRDPNILNGDFGDKNNIRKNLVILEDMSISQVIEFQNKVKKGYTSLKGYYIKGHTSIGYYQINLDTMSDFISKSFGKDTIMTKENQHKMGYALLIKAGLEKYINNNLSRKDFMINLADVWASLPLPDGKSRYHNDKAGNKNIVSYRKFEDAIKKIKRKKIKLKKVK